MAEGVITYETFRKFQRLEKDNEALQKLPDGFYDSCCDWIQRKEALYEKNKDSTMLREVENVMQIIRDILERRERKLLTLALHHIRGGAVPQNLLEPEKQCFDVVVAELEKNRSTNLARIKGERRVKITAPEPVAQDSKPALPEPTKIEVSQSIESVQAYVKVSILQPLERFVGTDGKIYGPTKSGDVLELPADVAQFLLEKKFAAAA